MKNYALFYFIFIMWILIIVGGGLLVVISSMILFPGSVMIGSLEVNYASLIKAAIAIILVIIWIYVLTKIKNWIFHSKITS